jgi:purine nucleoside phosphorylase
MFDGTHSRAQVAQGVQSITGGEMEACGAFVERVIGMSADLLIEGSQNTRYRPEDFVMPASEIDMTRFRLASPLSLGLILTYKCSSDCIYCYANRCSPADRVEMDLGMATKS